jgi:hypothetical protein
MCGKVEAEIEKNIDGSLTIKKIITNKWQQQKYIY